MSNPLKNLDAVFRDATDPILKIRAVHWKKPPLSRRESRADATRELQLVLDPDFL